MNLVYRSELLIVLGIQGISFLKTGLSDIGNHKIDPVVWLPMFDQSNILCALHSRQVLREWTIQRMDVGSDWTLTNFIVQ